MLSCRSAGVRSRLSATDANQHVNDVCKIDDRVPDGERNVCRYRRSVKNAWSNPSRGHFAGVTPTGGLRRNADTRGESHHRVAIN
jgi:hypothetical protein